MFVNGKNFDALQLATRTLWEVKTDNFDTYTDDLQDIVVRSQVPKLRHERALALACGFDFRVGVRSEAHKEALEDEAPDLQGHIGRIPAIDIASANGISSALARGYVTLASDSGHTADNQLWNSESARNFGREQIKKTHDVAMVITRARYGTLPWFNYFQGGSQGGHEALIAANFYPEDFNGVISGFPAYNLYTMHPGAIDYSQALYGAHTAANGYSYPSQAGEGWISRAQSTALTDAIVSVCDALDGATDRVVSNPGHPTCRAYTARLTKHDTSNPLRCAGGAAPGTGETCLSDPQIETLTRLSSRYNLPPGITVDGGLASYGRWPFLDGAVIASDPAHGVFNEDFGTSATSYDAFQYRMPSVGQVQLITQSLVTNPSQVIDFDFSQYADRVKTLSGWIDTSSVDYRRFRARGGKLIHYHGNSDVSITPYNSIDLYLRMTGQFVGNSRYLGQNPFWGSNDATTNAKVTQNGNVRISNGVVDDFYSFYLLPGFGHGHGYFQASVDWLTALENWVERGIAPRNTLTMTDAGANNLGSRPVCYFPYYPKFTSTTSSDTTLASNYTCARLDEYSYVR
ncbi:tannase/feruloyl esterase family alpha/beta hydrolase [Archangium violaceum]|nr:tannase/feruloyl esterase family alpha/beta hydrolase [Archangium violaceum]